MKYLGGKIRLGKHIAPILADLWRQNSYVAYFEPFCGALGVMRSVLPLLNLSPTARVIANDYHPDLIKMWEEVQRGTFRYPSEVSEDDYLKAKELQSPNALKAFVGFGLGFGGRFFGSFALKHANNKKEDFLKEMTNSLKRTAPFIQNVEFICKDYRAFQPKGMLIYADPPYKSEQFPIKYRRDTKHYDKFDTDAFWETMRTWSQCNMVVISEMSAPSDFVEIWEHSSHRSACQSAKTRYKSGTTQKYKKEKLFIHKSFLSSHPPPPTSS